MSGAMDRPSLRLGNRALGNSDGAAAIEATLTGLVVRFTTDRCVCLTGADLGMKIDGAPADAWQVHLVRSGSTLSLTSLADGNCRGYLCVSGGIDVPIVMGSRSTYVRAKLGGHFGRALQAGDVLALSEPDPIWRLSAGLTIPQELRPGRSFDGRLFAADGPEIDAFTQEGIRTFYSASYRVTSETDRMGCRLDGPEIERSSPADIISDAIPYGSVQVPGHGRPIILLADRQTTGGYTKIAVLTEWSAARASQLMPGSEVRFERVDDRFAISQLESIERDIEAMDKTRATYRSRGCCHIKEDH